MTKDHSKDNTLLVGDIQAVTFCAKSKRVAYGSERGYNSGHI